MWKFEEAIEFINSLQEYIYPLGFSAGLAGSILKKGFSEKDIDVIIYPLKKNSYAFQTYNFQKLLNDFPNFGLKFIRLPNHNQGYQDDGKDVRIFDYMGKRVDLFFLS